MEFLIIFNILIIIILVDRRAVAVQNVADDCEISADEKIEKKELHTNPIAAAAAADEADDFFKLERIPNLFIEHFDFRSPDFEGWRNTSLLMNAFNQIDNNSNLTLKWLPLCGQFNGNIRIISRTYGLKDLVPDETEYLYAAFMEEENAKDLLVYYYALNVSVELNKNQKHENASPSCSCMESIKKSRKKSRANIKKKIVNVLPSKLFNIHSLNFQTHTVRQGLGSLHTMIMKFSCAFIPPDL